MADSTLDDFFAKKDKSKKGKAKSKYTTSDTIAKKLEDGGRKIDSIPLKKDIKEKIPLSSNNQSIIVPSIANEVEDDEWKNIEEKEADYSGLRIQALSISSEKEKEEEQLKEQMLSEQNGESAKFSDGQSGPWKVVQNPALETEEDKPESELAKEEPPSSKPVGAYKPPAMRNSANVSSSSARRQHPRNAPLISSELHFPSLSTAIDNKFKISESDRSFQSVKHGIRTKTDTFQEPQLDLENKFSALHQGE